MIRAHSSFCATTGKCWCANKPAIAQAVLDDSQPPAIASATPIVIQEAVEPEGDYTSNYFPNPPYSKAPVEEFAVLDWVRVHTDSVVPKNNPSNLVGKQGVIRAFMGQGTLAVVLFPGRKVEASVPIKWLSRIEKPLDN